MSCLALFVALGGTSYAAISIGSGQIKNHSIQNVDLAPASVSSENVKDKSLRGKDLASQMVSTRTLRDESITEQKIALGSLTAQVIQKGSLTADLFWGLDSSPPVSRARWDRQRGPLAPPVTPEGVLSGNAASASATVDLANKSGLLIQGADNYSVACGVGDSPAAIGLYLDGTFVTGSRRNLTFRDNQVGAGTLVTMGVVSNVPAGTQHTVSVKSTPGCSGSSGFEGMVSAVALGG